jgi:hypothetical protein
MFSQCESINTQSSSLSSSAQSSSSEQQSQNDNCITGLRIVFRSDINLILMQSSCCEQGLPKDIRKVEFGSKTRSHAPRFSGLRRAKGTRFLNVIQNLLDSAAARTQKYLSRPLSAGSLGCAITCASLARFESPREREDFYRGMAGQDPVSIRIWVANPHARSRSALSRGNHRVGAEKNVRAGPLKRPFLTFPSIGELFATIPSAERSLGKHTAIRSKGRVETR